MKQPTDRVDQLRERAARFASELGPGPEPVAWTPEVEAWFTSSNRAADVLGELASWDAGLLREAAGPELDIDEDSRGRWLLTTAATVADRRAEPTDVAANDLARPALWASGEWLDERFRNFLWERGTAETRVEVLVMAREVVPVMARRLDRRTPTRNRHRHSVPRAQDLLTQAIEAAS